MGKGGEILVLDMGEPVRIVDLARDMIRLSGADPDHDPRSCSPACGPARSSTRSRWPPKRRRCRRRTRSCASRRRAPDIAMRSSRWSLVRARPRRRRRRGARAAEGVDSGVRAAGRGAGPIGRRCPTVRAAPRLIAALSIRPDYASTTPRSTIAAQPCARSIASMHRGRGHSAIPRPHRRTHAISRLNNTC